MVRFLAVVILILGTTVACAEGHDYIFGPPGRRAEPIRNRSDMDRRATAESIARAIWDNYPGPLIGTCIDFEDTLACWSEPAPLVSCPKNKNDCNDIAKRAQICGKEGVDEQKTELETTGCWGWCKNGKRWFVLTDCNKNSAIRSPMKRQPARR